MVRRSFFIRSVAGLTALVGAVLTGQLVAAMPAHAAEGPNLALQVTVTPPFPPIALVGDRVFYTADSVNHGDLPASPADITFRFEGLRNGVDLTAEIHPDSGCGGMQYEGLFVVQCAFSNPDLPPGASERGIFNVTYHRAGTFRAVVNARTAGDADMSDNEITHDQLVVDSPDLVLDQLEASPTRPAPGEAVRYVATASNDGPGPAPSSDLFFTLRDFVDGTDGEVSVGPSCFTLQAESDFWVRCEVGDVLPGGSVAAELTVSYAGAGTYRTEVTARTDRERDRTDNTATVDLEVREPVLPPTVGGLLGPVVTLVQRTVELLFGLLSPLR
jgi:hypothetical protein